MSSAPVLCSLAIEAFGNPLRRSHIEARKLPRGFEVWFSDEHLCPGGGTVFATRDSDYDARSFCAIITECRRRYPLSKDESPPFEAPVDIWRRVSVTGERGLKAHMLAVAFMAAYSALPSWLQQQSDASLAFLEGIVGGTIEGEWQSPLTRIRCNAERRKLDGDVLSLLRRYDLPANAANLRALHEWLDHDGDPQALAQVAERQARLAPFRHEIEAIAGLFSEWPIRGGGMMLPSSRSSMRKYMEQYVLEHGQMPKGEIKVVVKNAGMEVHMGPCDFDRYRKKALGE